MALQDSSDNWIYDDFLLQNHVIQFYSELYTSNSYANSVFNCITSYPMIKDEDRMFLEQPVSLEETRKALLSMGNFKSPCPDGFHSIFFKSHWSHIGNSIHKLVLDCFANPSSIKDINQTVVSLIPKCEDPSEVSQLRPIALCNVSYKIISKIISNRLKTFLPYIVSPNQSSFIAGRSSVDNILVMQEALHSLNLLKGNKGYMVIKLDLEKAYDRLEWSFIMESLGMLNIPLPIRDLIFQCISTSSLSVNWNGNKTGSFSASRVLSQGDPISPYLFVLALERLGHRIQDMVNLGTWKPLAFGRGVGPKLSHICFADDIVLFAEASIKFRLLGR